VDAHVVEEDLVEFGVAGDLPERLHGHAGRAHVEEEVGDPFVPRGLGVGAGQQHHPVRDVSQRGPDLLAVDHPVLAVLHRASLERGQVGAGVGLGVALAPDLLAGEDFGGVALLLLFGPVGDDRGAGHADAQDVQDGRGLGQRHLLLQDQLLHEGESLAAVFLGPGEPDESGVEELALPAAQRLVGFGTWHVGAGR